MSDKYVLACINGFKPSEAVIDYSSWLSLELNKELKLFHTIDQQYNETEGDLSGSIGLGSREELLKEMVEIEHQQNKLLQHKAKLILESGKKQAKNRGVDKIDLCSRKGRLLENILELKDKISVAVIGKFGKRHQGVQTENTIGHKVEALVRNLKKPILIVSEDFKKPKSFCLAYDNSDAANKALEFFTNQNSFLKCEMHLVYVGDESKNIKAALEKAKEKLSKNFQTTKVSILKGQVDEALDEYVDENNISILAMGAFGHNWLHDFVMGSITSKIIKGSKKPILLVR